MGNKGSKGNSKPANQQDQQDQKEQKEQKTSTVDDSFCNNLFSTIFNDNLLDKKSSLILSPLSISVALTIAMLGAKNNTLKEMMNILHPNNNNNNLTTKEITSSMINICNFYNKTYKNDPIITIANKLFIKTGFKVLNEYIAASGVDSIETFDIDPNKAAETVNSWCAKCTNNMISDIVTPTIMKTSDLVIANAIYFKGIFELPFDIKNTQQNISFYNNKDRINEISKVSMMYNGDDKQHFIQKFNNIYDIVKLKYRNSNISLILAINNYTNNNECNININSINNSNWKYDKLDLYLPKFKIEYSLELSDILKKMGIIDAFDGSKADFSFITGDKGLYISKVLHKAVIEVDEEGTVAAAVTAVVMSRSMAMPAPKPTIRFDKPFTFYIFDDSSKNVLFSGCFMGQ